MFADRTKIIIRSGKGGDGHCSFRRELYVANGGPDGGDGGKGGDLVFEVDEGLNTLMNYRHKRKFSAGDGEEGGKRRCHGKSGEDLVLKVPPGTVIRELKSGKVIADMSGDNKRQIVLKGGKGGLGNQHFATATMQVPKYAQPGKPAMELEVLLELKVIADVGLVGFPNVGKSTLLSRVTNAEPKIANYHFTTLNPNLGVVDLDDSKGFVMADIPGLIEGASEGAGLGHEFLRHIERTKMMIHVVDVAGTEGRDPVDDIYKINTELASYNKDLANRPQVIAANKMDLMYPEADSLDRLKAEFEPKGIPVFAISGVSGQGLAELLYYVSRQLEQMDSEPVVFAQEYFPEDELIYEELPYTVTVEEGVYVVEGSKIEKMLGYTNLDSEKGFAFFQRFLKEGGILDELEQKGITEGDTVKMYGLQFDYYK
ncbi:MAG: GTPase ObgE [Ruminococcus sp.]|nr:GTPase ObgE [Ruminococcus sp.]